MKPSDRMKLIASWLKANPGTQFARIADDDLVCPVPSIGAIVIKGYSAQAAIDAPTMAAWMAALVFAAEAEESYTPMAGASMSLIAAQNSTATIDIFIFVWKELWEKERKPWGDTTAYA